MRLSVKEEVGALANPSPVQLRTLAGGQRNRGSEDEPNAIICRGVPRATCSIRRSNEKVVVSTFLKWFSRSPPLNPPCRSSEGTAHTKH
jgi:hypothetical protein